MSESPLCEKSFFFQFISCLDVNVATLFAPEENFGFQGNLQHYKWLQKVSVSLLLALKTPWINRWYSQSESFCVGPAIRQTKQATISTINGPAVQTINLQCV